MLWQLFSDPLGGLMAILYTLPALIVGFTLHEWAHALAAVRMGDDTPRIEGRLTLAPYAHIDWRGLAMFIVFGFGWAKPVRTNPANYTDERRGRIVVALAGVLGNLAICVVCSLFVEIIPPDWLNGYLTKVFVYMVYVNAVLIALNMLPIPPLDMSKVVRALFPGHESVWQKLDRYGFLVLIVLSVTGLLDIALGTLAQLIMSGCVWLWCWI